MNQPFDALLAARAGAVSADSTPWLSRLREQGVRQYRDMGLPTLRDEDWKYTSVKPIAKLEFLPASDPSRFPEDRVSPIEGLHAHRLVFINGHFSPDHSDLRDLPDGAKICSLSQVLAEDPVRLEPWLGRLTAEPGNGFRALNSAFLLDGLFIDSGEGVSFDKPIECVFASVGESQDVTSQPRNLIVGRPGSRFTVVERYLSLDDARYLTNTVTEVFALADASIDHIKIQQESVRGFHIASWLVEQSENSKVHTHNMALGGAIARTDLNIHLKGGGAECVMNGIYACDGKQHVDNHTQVDHQVADTRSREFYKGVLDQRSRAVFHGRVIVHQDAQRTDAQQQNKNLLLSKDAEIDTKPQLEIYADDVACSHGATVGQLDEDALFYCNTRGIDERTARSLLTFAFANDIVHQIELPAVREHIEHELTSKLFSIDKLEELL